MFLLAPQLTFTIGNNVVVVYIVRVWTSVGLTSFMIGLVAPLTREWIHSACLSACISNASSRQFVKLTVKPMALAAGMS